MFALFTVMLLLWSQATVFVWNVYAQDETDLATTMCYELDTEASEFTDWLINVLETRWAKIDALVGADAQKRQDAKTLRMDFIDEMYAVQESIYWCETPDSLDKEGVKNMLRTYIKELQKIIIRGWYVPIPKLTVYSEPEAAMITLQKQLWDLLGSFSAVSDKMWSVDDYNLNMKFTEDGLGFSTDMRIQTNSDVDNTNNSFHSLVNVIWNINVDDDEYNSGFDVNGEISLDASLISNKLYFWLKKLIFESKKSNEEIAEMMKTIPVIKSIWANNFLVQSLDESFMALNMNFTELMQQDTQLQNALKWNVSVVQFINKEGNTYYGYLNPEFCKVLPNEIKEDCLSGAEEMLAESNYKWVFFLTIDGWNYKFGITDNFTNDKMPEQYLNNVNMLNWNNQALQSILIPLDDSGLHKATWENGQFKLVYGEDNFIFTLSGPLTANLIDLKWMIESLNESEEVSWNFQLMIKKTNNTDFDLKLTANITWGPWNLFTMALNWTHKNAAFKQISIPSPLMTFEEFTAKVEAALELE